jgi:hypothetical protein
MVNSAKLSSSIGSKRTYSGWVCEGILCCKMNINLFVFKGYVIMAEVGRKRKGQRNKK